MTEPSSKDAERFVAAAVTRSASVGNKLFVAAATLLLLWASSLETQYRKANAVFASRRTINFELDVNRSLLAGDDPVDHSASADVSAHLAPTPRPWRTKDAKGITRHQRKVWEDRRAAFSNRFAMLRARSAVLREAVPFEFAGLKFGTPPQFAALTWLFLVACAAVYLLVQRRICLALLAKSLRRLRELDPEGGFDQYPLAPAMPFWLAPLPTRSGAALTAGSLARALGWSQSGGEWRTVTIASLALIFSLVSLRVAWIGVVSVGAVGSSWTLVGCMFTLLSLWALLAVEWWRPVAIADCYDEVDFPLRPSRRAFLLTALGSVLSFALARSVFASVTSARTKPREKSPRHRAGRRSRASHPLSGRLAPGFYRNPRSQVAFYVSEDGSLLAPSVPRDLSALDPIVPDDLGKSAPGAGHRGLWICKSVFSITYETAALDSMARGDPDGALAVLLKGVRQALATRQDPTRLAELFATITFRRDPSLDIRSFQGRLPPELFARLPPGRVEAWGDESSNWRKQRAKASYRWSSLPM